MFVDRASLYNLFQMKPTRCTLLLSIFISASVHVSGNYMAIIRRIHCICATLLFLTLYGWLSGLLYIYISFSTGSGQLCPHHQKNLLYLCDTVIFHCMGGCLVCCSIHSEKY